jgi:hypothetical protein
MQIIEKGLSNLPGSAPVMQQQAGRQVAEIQSAVEDLARQYGPVGTKQSAGEALQRSARAAGQRFETRREALDDALENIIGRDTLVPVHAVTQLRAQMAAERDAAPASMGRILNHAIENLDAVISDAARNGGTIPFNVIRATRTRIGRELSRPDIAGYSPGVEGTMRRVYGALREDIRIAADQLDHWNPGAGARRALETHDRYVRALRGDRDAGVFREAPLSRLQKMENAGTGEQAFNYAMSLAKEGGSRLYALRRSMPPAEWDVVAGTVLGRMGRATPANQGAVALGEEAGDFSVNTFLTNWNKLAPEARAALFGGTRYADLAPELNRLMRVVARVKDADKMANPSGTARNLFIGLGVLEAGRDVVHGEPKSAAGKIAFGVLAPRYAARLITNPEFVRWLAQAGSIAQGNPNGMASQIMRLAGIAEAEPAIRESIAQYIAALRAPPAAPASADTAR